MPGIGILQILLWLLALPVAAQGPRQAAPPTVTRNPHGPVRIACENCHTSTSWKPIRGVPEFSHETTRYPLRGMHQGVTCTECHTKPVFTNVGATCADCHADIHRRQLGANCQQCHTVTGWKVSVQAIQNHFNRFPLLGGHAALDCATCHRSAATGQFQGLQTQCYACHASDFQRTVSPNHVTASFPATCQQCHGMISWVGAKFDHTQVTGFALTGSHARLQCADCHVGGKFTGTQATCVSCHIKDYQGAGNPNHVQAGVSQNCQNCHTTVAWQPATFDHNALTKFALTGAHVAATCSQCHISGNFAGTPTTCVSCHLNSFQSATNPNHSQAGFPQTCQSCHTTVSWQPASFDHGKTAFPLTGAHAPVACSSCHINNVFTSLPTTCVSCHLRNFQNTANPNHTQAGFPQTCQSCHTTVSWQPASFDHNTYTGFPLTGAHVNVGCTQCHIGGKYAGTPATCYGCHLKDYQTAANPNHIQAGFPTDCTVCHATTAWLGAKFNHSTTGFPLTGAHTNVACSSCHINGNYNLTASTCVSCHLKNFQSTTSPQHLAAGFPQQCELCHTTAAWQPSSFNHSTTAFPLTGAHTAVACSNCHVNNNYTTLPTDCYGCHRTDYQTATSPNHLAAGFPTTCLTCHSTTTWLGATFDHTWFRIPHHGVSLCSDCHTNASDYAIFNCTNCHTKTQTDPKHRGVSGYVWNSANCYQCHRNGGG